MVFTPWANQKFLLLDKQAREQADISGIIAGRFKQFNHGRGFFFVEEVDEKVMRRVFVAVDHDGKKILLVAKTAHPGI